MESYESKIIGIDDNLLKTVHDYARLDLNKTTNKFVLHIFWYTSSEYQPYIRTVGKFKITKSNNSLYNEMIELYPKKAFRCKNKNDNPDYRKQFEHIGKAMDHFDKIVPRYINLGKEELEPDPHFEKFMEFYIDQDEEPEIIVTDFYPFEGVSIYKKTKLRKILA